MILKMKNKKQKEKVIKKHKSFDKGQIFVKAMAAFLAVLMLVGTSATLIFALMG